MSSELPLVKKSAFARLAPIVIGAILVCAGLMFLWLARLKIPDLRALEERKVVESTKIYDRTGKVLLFDVNEGTKRTVVLFEDISRHLKNATVAIEDAEFYEHRGVRPTAVIRAALANAVSLSFGQGGSTITQQVVKNSLLTSEKHLSRKIKEWVLALKVEQSLTKEEVLSLYLNETPYGGSIYGVEEASKIFFGVSSTDVSLAQAAYIAALPQAPTYYSPYGNHRDALDKRKNLVLDEMFENHFITEEELGAAKDEVVEFLPRTDNAINAPHFVMFVKEYLEQKYGNDMVERGGLRITTTLDHELQQKAEEITNRFALENEKTFNAENAALVAVDPNTGGILTMVGSRDYFDTAIDGNFNVALAHRQPGSAFKPFVYETAFEKGYTPETIVFDVETEFSTACTPDGKPRAGSAPDACYMPGNYDNVFRGPVSLRNALAQSINIPAIKVLYLAGLDDSLATARKMGISSLSDIGRYGLTLVLGGGEVSLLEMTGAYGVFATGGVRNSPVAVLEVRDAHGNILETHTPKPSQVLKKDAALTISDVLSDNIARTPAFGANSFLNFEGRDVAVKTGTTNDYRDAWIIGYTPNIAVGAWAGNNDNTPMEKKVAGFIIAPLWNAFMQEVMKKIPDARFEKPAYKDTSGLKPILRGVWQGDGTGVHSILHAVDKNDPLGTAPQNPAQDPQFASWEYAVQQWVVKNAAAVAAAGTQTPPSATTMNVTPVNTPQTQ
jgi:penicillin-binding protein 1C